jgi:hypothetical protein
MAANGSLVLLLCECPAGDLAPSVAAGSPKRVLPALLGFASGAEGVRLLFVSEPEAKLCPVAVALMGEATALDIVSGAGTSTWPSLLAGGETWREDVSDSVVSPNGRKLELICLDSGGGGGSATTVAWRLTLGEVAVPGVANDPALAVDVPVV